MRNHGYIAFLVGILLTTWTCVLVMHAQDTRIQNNFERDAQKIAADTSVRLQTYFDTLSSLRGLFAVQPEASADDFARFLRELRLTARYPGFQAIEFVRRVPAAELPAFDAAMRRRGRSFGVHPQLERSEHFVIQYCEPLKGNERALGLDLASLPLHLRLIERGRDSDQVIASGRIALVQDAGGRAGFIARLPVYRAGMPTATVDERRAALLGMVAIVFKVDNLMHEVVDPAMANQLALRIHDAGMVTDGPTAAREPANTLYDSFGPNPETVPGLHAMRRLDVAQRQWHMEFAARPGPAYERDLTTVVLVAAGGLVISTLVAAQLIASARSRRLATRLRGTLEEQRAFQDSASVGIARFADGAIMRCNRGLEEIMGYDPDELIGKPTALLTGAALGADPFAQAGDARRWQSEMELVRKDGSTIWCLIHGKAFGEAALAHAGVWVIQDITDRKKMEAALLDARHGLEHSLAEVEQQKANVEQAHEDLSRVLNTLKQAQTNLITSEKMASLGALVAGIAHELNTPIGNSLLTATALADTAQAFARNYADGGIKRSALEAFMADTRRACEILAASLKRAADLINSFKQVAVDQTSDKRRRFALAEVVNDTLATFSAQLRRANCVANIDVPSALTLDSYPGAFGQVLSNLLGNALLHAFEGRGHGTVTLCARALDGDVLEFVFADDGVGMPYRVLHQVFDPFFTTKMGQGGSGLGMNIVYNIVTSMLGGTIDVVSVEQGGTTVTLKLPRTAPSRDAGHAPLDLVAS